MSPTRVGETVRRPRSISANDEEWARTQAGAQRKKLPVSAYVRECVDAEIGAADVKTEEARDG
jgi:hypothetical protein